MELIVCVQHLSLSAHLSDFVLDTQTERQDARVPVYLGALLLASSGSSLAVSCPVEVFFHSLIPPDVGGLLYCTSIFSASHLSRFTRSWTIWWGKIINSNHKLLSPTSPTNSLQSVNCSILGPVLGYAFLKHSHPSLSQRVFNNTVNNFPRAVF